MIYDTKDARCLKIQNPKLINLFSKITRDSEGKKISINSLRKIESELDGQDINEKIKEITNNSISNKNDYQELMRIRG